MQLSEKIQKLRKEHNLTQEQLSEKLFVSRTAVSKWETGRGMPSMESLQMIAKLFHITLDELLSTEEIVVIAKRDNQDNILRFAAHMDSIINLSALLSLLLPLYKAEENGFFYSVPLYQLGGWQGIVFMIAPVIMAVFGILQMLIAGREKGKLHTVTGASVAGVHICQILILFYAVIPTRQYCFSSYLRRKAFFS